MITEREYAQIVSAIKVAKSPVSQGKEETVWKSHVLEILINYVEKDENGRKIR